MTPRGEIRNRGDVVPSLGFLSKQQPGRMIPGFRFANLRLVSCPACLGLYLLILNCPQHPSSRRVTNCIRALASLYLPIYPATIMDAYEVCC